MTEQPKTTIGVDLGDKRSVTCVLSAEGEVVEEGQISTTRLGIEKYFKRRGRARVVLEVGTHSPWVSRVLEEMGHETIVANARRVKLISENVQKGDQIDAELLARLGRADVKLLAPITHRKEGTQADLAMIRARDALVRTRTSLVSATRGLVKSQGERLSSCPAESFHERVSQELPEALKEALLPMLQVIEKLTLEIRSYDKQLAEKCRTKYPETEPLLQISGVGLLTALCYVLTLEDPSRFVNGRQAGAYLGLVPRKRQSGDSNPQLGITKNGDSYLRKLLVQCAQVMLGRCGGDSELRRWGLQKAARGGKGAKKRAIVGVARKLSVIMYRLWKTGERYQPFPKGKARSARLGQRKAVQETVE